jgi:hypothetical protein
LHCRLLSSLQFEVGRLEDELDRLDQWEQSNGDPESRLASKNVDDKYSDPRKVDESFIRKKWRSRPQVFGDLRTKLLEYGERVRCANAVLH